MPADAKKATKREPEHEDVVATLLGLQAKLRGDALRTKLPHFVDAPDAVAIAVEDPTVVSVPEAEPESARVIRLPESTPEGYMQERLASIQERLDLLEEGLTSLMIQIEDRGKS